MTLLLMSNNLHLHSRTLGSCQLLTPPNPSIHKMSDISLQPASKVFVQCAASTQYNVLIQSSPDINRRALDNAVDNLRQRRKEFGAVNLRVEKDFRCKETFVTNVHNEGRTASRLHRSVLCETTRVSIEAVEFLDNIRADVAKLLFDLLGGLQAGIWLASVTEQRLDEVGDISTGDRDRLDGRSDNVALRDG